MLHLLGSNPYKIKKVGVTLGATSCYTYVTLKNNL
jgi:hypothetical protein